MITTRILKYTLPLVAALLGPACVAAAQQQTWESDPAAYAYEQHFPIAENRGSVALWQLLKKLNTRASLMTIIAHPDDEDGGMLAFESRGAGARVALFTLTRGEGGQNIMGGDLWDQLGLVRTQELLAADRYYGAQQYWGSVADFGFSKTREEALQQWTHERVLCDAVRAVRAFRPLVITSSFVGGVTDGHGQHQVSGQLAQEVYEAAGDPRTCPGTGEAWQPLKVYGHVPFAQVTDKGIYDYATQKWTPVRFYDYIQKRWSDGVPSTTLTVQEGQYDAVLGETYSQVAAMGVGQQRSQHSGPDVPGIGPRVSSYHRYAARVATSGHEAGMFDGIDTSLASIASLAPATGRDFLVQGLQQLQQQMQDAVRLFAASAPEKCAPSLAKALIHLDALDSEAGHKWDHATDADVAAAAYNVHFELARKREQLQDALALALGLSLQAEALPAHPGDRLHNAVPSAKVRVDVQAASATNLPVTLDHGSPEITTQHGSVSAVPDTAGAEAADEHMWTRHYMVSLAADAPITRPAFSRPTIEQPFYNLRLPQPEMHVPDIAASATFHYSGVSIPLHAYVEVAQRVTGFGTLYEPLAVLPAISITVTPAAGAVPLDAHTLQVGALIHSNVSGPADGTVKLQLPDGWLSSPAEMPFHIAAAGEEQNMLFTVTPAHMQAKRYTLTAAAKYAGHTYTDGYTVAGYPGLRRSYYFRPASFRAVGVDAKVAPGLKVGYIMGTGDEVPQSLEFLGVHPQLLSAQDITGGDLQQYDVIVLGVRAYAARPELATSTNRLLEYAKHGGVVIVQYNTAEYNHSFGPYPYTLSERPENVVDETDAVSLQLPEHPLLNWPNKITTHDFDGWVEERGHSFMRTWDPHYQALTEAHDPDQDPQKGGLLCARYGNGAYVYVAYALYRQLPEGVPGAYRIFANLLSLGKNPLIAPDTKHE